MLLQGSNLLAHGSWGHVQFGGGGLEAAVAGRSLERAQEREWRRPHGKRSRLTDRLIQLTHTVRNDRLSAVDLS
jgi:hypothetical protein